MSAHPNSTHAHQASPSTAASAAGTENATAAGSTSVTTTAPVPHIRIVPHLDAPRSLHFDVVDKDVSEGFVLKIGRFTDKQTLPNRVTFKSKVVSRGHAEIFTENGKFFIRDTKSSSGTFLNHTRLSPPGVESKPTPLKDGDIIQLGVDYQGGTQEIYRCVKMRLELNRSWQQQANPFRENTLKAIRSLTTANAASSTDCCICLFRIASFQSLFVAPCSHVYHYKCIRPMLVANHPSFLCPLCRTFADLEDTVEIDDPIEEEMPLQSPAAAVENGAAGHDSVEQINDTEPAAVAQQEESAPDPMEEVSTTPTPHSEQAHTFQPPENRPAPLRIDTPAQPSSPTSPTSPVHHQSSTYATISPMDIAGAGAGPSTSDSAVQQSPSSAFFMAPSPPMFVSSFGVSPIPFAAPSSSNVSPRQSLSSSTTAQHDRQVPSSPSSHMGHMIQNFVRNITIPHRNRSRTNSNSATSPISATHLHVAGGASTNPGQQHQGGSTDVFGKTLVMTPPQHPSILLANHRTGTGHSGISELGVVSEMDGEPALGDDMLEHHGGGSSSRSSGSSSGRNSSRSSSQSREGMDLEQGAETNLALRQSQTIVTEASM
ncbi:hypothetical protein BGZ58_008437 [Dissophora ornata]|nr:hypothetical protein BGZ58_008437 [Dissophora ornata]